jgi:AcrR family transcriptional regulator
MAIKLTSDVSNRICHAATALFARQGYHGTTTAEISRLAQVNEVTLFRYFNCKEDLYLFTLQSGFGTIKPRLEQLLQSPENNCPESTVPQILKLLVEVTTFSPELARLVMIAFIEVHGKAQALCVKNLTPLLTAITGSLTASMQCGMLKDLNAVILTAAMSLPVFALSELKPNETIAELNSAEIINEFSSFWLKVLMPTHEVGSFNVEPSETVHAAAAGA